MRETINCIKRIQNLVKPVFRLFKNHTDKLALGLIFIIIVLSSSSPLSSGSKLNFDADFFQYASRHEAVRKSLLEHHMFPLRSHWFGGGFPTLSDPEDPSLNPLVIMTILFGTVMGLKLIVLVSLLIGGLSAYALARHVLDYTRWGALYTGLVFGTSIFIPLRIYDGNPNEVYAAFLPLCLLLIGLACKGRKIVLLILPIVLYTMLSDGKIQALMIILYIGIFCLIGFIPVLNIFRPKSLLKRSNVKPLKIFILALILTFLIGMIRFLPALELIHAKGGMGKIKTISYPNDILAYNWQQLWQQAVSWKKKVGFVTIGWIPIILFGLSCVFFWKRSLPWTLNFFLFAWLLLAFNAPIDLFKLLSRLPVFNAITWSNKYFSFQIVFTLVVISGQFFWLLRKLRPRWLEHFFSVGLIVASLWFLYPRMERIQRNTYNLNQESSQFVFFNRLGINPDEFTIEFWAKPAEEVTPTLRMDLISGTTSRGRPHLTFNYRKEGKLGFYFDFNESEKNYISSKTRNWNPEWYHVAVVRDKKEAVLYVNGKSEGRTDISSDTNLHYSDNSFLIGAGFLGNYPFRGCIDEFRIWSIALSEQEVRELIRQESAVNYNQRLVYENLILYVPFDEGRGDKAHDISSNNLLGEINGAKWVEGVKGKAILFEKTQEHIKQEDFYNVKGQDLSRIRKEPFHAVAYFNLLRNIGTVDWYTGMPIGEHVIPKYFIDSGNNRIPNPDYIDEVFFMEDKDDIKLRFSATKKRYHFAHFMLGKNQYINLNQNIFSEASAGIKNNIQSLSSVKTKFLPSALNKVKAKFQPNSITLHVNIKIPCTLIVNQNYHRDWHSDKGELFSKDGLIALQLQETGSYEINLLYKPRSFLIGLLISGLGLAMIIFIFWAIQAGRIKYWAQHSLPFIKRINQAILWIID